MDLSSRESAPLVHDRPQRWGPWATVAWGAGAAVVLIVSQTLGAIAYIAWTNGLRTGVPIPTENLESNGAMLSVAFLLSTPLVLAYFLIAVRLARVPFGEYLALNWPRWSDVLIGIGGLLAVLVVAGLGAILTGQEIPDFMGETFRTAREAGVLPLFFFSFAVLAPVQEELFFRGFLYRGLSAAIGPWITIVLTSAVWSVVHLQYDWFFIVEIFALGVVFGWLRLRSNSTILTMLLHGGLNMLALVNAGVMVG
jgi:membrane protease YdiL (CAAX protease family)